MDIVETSIGPKLIELEIADPMLFFDSFGPAAQTFADALLEKLEDCKKPISP